MKPYAILFDGMLVTDRSGRAVTFETRGQAQDRIAELGMSLFAVATKLQAKKDATILQVRALRP